MEKLRGRGFGLVGFVWLLIAEFEGMRLFYSTVGVYIDKSIVSKVSPFHLGPSLRLQPPAPRG